MYMLRPIRHGCTFLGEFVMLIQGAGLLCSLDRPLQLKLAGLDSTRKRLLAKSVMSTCRTSLRAGSHSSLGWVLGNQAEPRTNARRGQTAVFAGEYPQNAFLDSMNELASYAVSKGSAKRWNCKGAHILWR